MKHSGSDNSDKRKPIYKRTLNLHKPPPKIQYNQFKINVKNCYSTNHTLLSVLLKIASSKAVITLFKAYIWRLERREAT